ncbi:MAG: AbrB/MazE/SpoVT family DNA-binding domain-containing protein, partial [Nitrososphaerota archaeon]
MNRGGCMAIRKKLHKVGGSEGGIIIPKALLELLGLRQGDTVDIDLIKDGEAAIIIRPVKQAAGEG